MSHRDPHRKASSTSRPRGGRTSAAILTGAALVTLALVLSFVVLPRWFDGQAAAAPSAAPSASSPGTDTVTTADAAPTSADPATAPAPTTPAAEPPERPFEEAPELARGEVPRAFDDTGQPLGTTPEHPDPVRAPDAPPDPIASTPTERARRMSLPAGLRIDPSWRAYGATSPDDQTRGWNLSHATSMAIELPDDVAEELGRGSKTIEFSVLYIGDQSDVRDSLIGNPGEDEHSVSRVVEVAGHPAVLTILKGSSGMRLDMAVHGEIIVGMSNGLLVDGELTSPTEEQFIALAGEYVRALYGE